MSDTPRTKAATRMAFTSEYMVEIEEAQKLERELADMTKQIDPYEREAAKAAINVLKRELAEVKNDLDFRRGLFELQEYQFNKVRGELAEARKQRNTLAEALKSLCKAIISEEPQDITDLLKQSGVAIAAVKGGNDE